MKQKQKAFESPIGSSNGDEQESNFISSSSEDKTPRRTRGARRTPSNSKDIKIKILKFERKLEANEFLDWLDTVEHIFDNKDIPEDKKVKLVALRLR